MSAEPFVRTGGCHCRALRYTLTKPPLAVYVCHCTDCQSLTGAAFAIGVVVPADAFALSGQPRMVDRTLGSGLVSSRSICPDCGVWVCGGSRLEALVPRQQRVIRGGTFDDTSWLRPTAHYWARSAQPWVVIPDGVTVHETQPTFQAVNS